MVDEDVEDEDEDEDLAKDDMAMDAEVLAVASFMVIVDFMDATSSKVAL